MVRDPWGVGTWGDAERVGINRGRDSRPVKPPPYASSEQSLATEGDSPPPPPPGADAVNPRDMRCAYGKPNSLLAPSQTNQTEKIRKDEKADQQMPEIYRTNPGPKTGTSPVHQHIILSN